MMDRDSMIFYRSWLEAIKNLPREIQGEVLTAIIEYGLYGETTGSLKPITSAMLAMVKPQIDVNNAKYANGMKGAEFGIKGGRPKNKNPNETPSEPQANPNETPDKPQENPRGTPNVNENVNENGNGNENGNESEETSPEGEAKKAEQARKLAAAKAATLKRRDEFYHSLVPFVERYGKEMLRDFFDYWSELNKLGTKMRFETNKTWEVAKRLATWAKKEKFDGKSGNKTSAAGGSIAGAARDKAASRSALEAEADAILEHFSSGKV